MVGEKPLNVPVPKALLINTNKDKCNARGNMESLEGS